jgi:hypothetical protein
MTAESTVGAPSCFRRKPTSAYIAVADRNAKKFSEHVALLTFCFLKRLFYTKQVGAPTVPSAFIANSGE